MSVFHNNILAGASGGGDDPLYVDDLFSVDLWDGNGSTRNINNGIDLDGEGGMVFFMNRHYSNNRPLYDTERGVNKFLKSDNDDAEITSITNGLTAFNSNGFTLGSNGYVNGSSYQYASWTFRKAEKFFTMVTYSGNSFNQTIDHDLGSVPGMIVIKEINADATGGWHIYHREVGATTFFRWDTGNAPFTAFDFMANTAPTSTQFFLSDKNHTNQSGKNYIAYLFAHDEAEFGENGDEVIIKCGGWTGNGGTQEINIGFEPQFIWYRNVSQYETDSLQLADTMRGFPGKFNDEVKRMDMSGGVEQNYGGAITPTANGVYLADGDVDTNKNNRPYVYLAIRRPNKPAVAATDVFNVQVLPSNSASNSTFISTGFDVDVCLDLEEAGDVYQKTNFMFRLLGNGKELDTQTTSGTSGTTWEFDHSNGFKQGATNGTHAMASFRRAPGFLDVVRFEGDGSFSTRSHNLGVTPELVVQKSREFADEWNVITSGKIQYFNRTQAASNSSVSNNHSSTVFGVNTDSSSDSYICLLFASLSGVSKVGTYSGTGNNIDVDCGFTAGARLVIIKRQDSTGDWYTFNSAHGIVSGNDPYKFLNEDGAATNTDYIDPLNAGFTITSSAPAGLNTSGGTYLFLAIA